MKKETFINFYRDFVQTAIDAPIDKEDFHTYEVKLKSGDVFTVKAELYGGAGPDDVCGIFPNYEYDGNCIKYLDDVTIQTTDDEDVLFDIDEILYIKDITKRLVNEAQTKQSICQMMRELRHKSGMTLDDLASKTGINKSTISQMENGKQNISLGNLLKMSDAIGAEVVVRRK